MIAVIVGGGVSSRFNENKLKLHHGIYDTLTLSALPFIKEERIEKVLVAVNDDDFSYYSQIFQSYEKVEPIIGGATRQQTVEKCLSSITDTDYVIIHDGARPFVSSNTIKKVIDALKGYEGVTAVAPLTESIRKIFSDSSKSVSRDNYVSVRTPQAFVFSKLKKALIERKKDYSDEASLFEEFYQSEIGLIYDEPDNIKLTTPTDFYRNSFRIGVGNDVHALAMNRKLILGGVDIPYEKGLMGVSDADVLTHAIMDALLSAIGERDIGHLFPPSDPKYLGISSMLLLEEVMLKVKEKGYSVVNVSAEIAAEAPKLSPYLDSIEKNIASETGGRVTISATTHEKLGIVGLGKGMAAIASVLLQKADF